MSRTIFGPLRATHRLVETIRIARIDRNHQAEYTAYRPSLSNTEYQNGPNWLM